MDFFEKHQTKPYEDDVRKVNALFKNGILYDEKGVELKNNRAIHGDIIFVNKNNDVVGIDKHTKQHIVGILYLNKVIGFTKKSLIIKFVPLSNKYPTYGSM